MTADPADDVIDTAGKCLTANCDRPATQHLQVRSRTWWPECDHHATELRADMPDCILAVREATSR